MLRAIPLIALFSMMAHAATVPDGFKRVNNFLVSDNPATFKEAQQSCKSLGLKLPVVSNVNDQLQLSKSLDPRRAYWIGAKYDRSKSKWIWAESNATVVYENWGSGYPWKDGNFCALQNVYGEWNSINCDVKFYYLCEEKFLI